LAVADARNAAERATGVAGAAVHGITKFMDLTPEEFKHGYLNALARDAVTEKRARKAMPLAFSFAFHFFFIHLTSRTCVCFCVCNSLSSRPFPSLPS
jgi:hypothetical protein